MEYEETTASQRYVNPDTAPRSGPADTGEPPLSSTIVHRHPDARHDIATSPKDGHALCLSGGGYRAMLFHLGTLWRLNDAGLMTSLKMISSVSGGSITAGVLALAFPNFKVDADGIAENFRSLVAEPIMALGRQTIDWQAALLGLIGGVLGFGSASTHISSQYRRHLYANATLQDLPDSATGPDFVFNATSLQTGELWRLSRDEAWDYRVGAWGHPSLRLADAVAASSAFPPFLSPFVLKLPDHTIAAGTASGEPFLTSPPYTTRIAMTDGGVYDNLGLEAPWRRWRCILVSDAGGQMGMAPRPHFDWVRQTKRVLDVVDNQVRDLRKHQVIAALADHQRDGAYWGIRSEVSNYPVQDTLPCPPKTTMRLASIETRLKSIDVATQRRLVNWGFAICDAAIRSWVRSDLPAPTTFPFAGGVGTKDTS
jgi:NTE family protein